MNNVAAPLKPVPLELIGGLYTEATPETIPLGASPCALNCDFILGSNLQRPGKLSAFFFDQPETFKPSFAQSVADPGSSGEVPWSSPTNVELDVPGTYASVVVNFSGGGAAAFDQSVNASHDQAFPGPPDTITLGPVTPSLPNEWGIIFLNGIVPASIPSGGGSWSTDIGPGGGNAYISGLLQSGQFSTTQSLSSGASPWASLLSMFFTDGNGTPAIVQSNHADCSNVTQATVTFTGNTTPGNTLLVCLTGTMPHPPGGGNPAVPVVSDTQGNVFGACGSVFLPSTSSPVNYFGVQIALFAANITGATHDAVTVTGLANLFNSAVIFIAEVSHLKAPTVGSVSQELQALNYHVSLSPTQQISGVEAVVYGHQTSSDASSIITVKLFNGSGPSQLSLTGQLPSVDGPVTFGSPTQNWGYALTPTLLSDPGFGIEVEATSAVNNVSYNVYSIQLVLWLTPNPPPSFNYLKTYAETGGEVLNMVLGDNGIFYQEDAINNPGQLTGVYEAVQLKSFAHSATVDDREFIAISNLQNGTNIPMKYTAGAGGSGFTRLTQVGPGAPPSVTSTSSGSAVNTITQNAAFTLPTDGFLLFSDSPSDHGSFGTPATPGNVCTVVYKNTDVLPSYLAVGSNIFISGWPTINGNRVNNDPTGALAPPYYTITSIGQPITGQTYYDAFTFTVNFTTFLNPHTPAGCTVQATVATMTTAVQVPNLEVGDSFALTGTGGAPPTGYDSTWQVLTTPNASQLLITSTELLNNVAIYGFVLQTGTNPTVGEAVTVTLTNNGNGVFNVTNAIITAASPGTFSLSLPGPNIATATESGAGLIFGTIFTFDAFAIIGNKSGGQVVTTGVIATGQRMCCYSFLTSDGFVTKPSPVFTFDVVGGASKLAVAQLLTGPSNVIARIVHFTPANGDQFYNIENPVTVTVNGVSTTFTSTYVNDNTTTNVTFSFTDAVLTSGQEIDIEGYNLFENFEVGACTAVIPYAQRLFLVGEQNKVFNLLNYSFDGGIRVVQSAGGGTFTYPAGWVVDPTAVGNGTSVVTSPIFGNSFSITNTSGSTQAVYGRISQNAFQDEDMVPIIASATAYSIRVTCSNPTANSTGALVVDLYSNAIGQSLGIFSVQCAQMSTSMQIFTGTFLTTTFAQVPNDLVIRIYMIAMANNSQVIVDRIEPFPTEAPNLNGQIIGSYQNEYEQFDRITGIILGTQQNQQPITTGFTFGSGALYLMKTGSMIAVADNPSTEPAYWNPPRVVSPSVGAPGPYCVTSSINQPNSGEQWAVITNTAGAFLFQGQQPIKLSEEIQSVINQINPAAAYTMWVMNDIINRRVLWGVPLNQLDADGESPFWLPAGKISAPTNPTTPNVILEMNYKSLNTAGAVTESVQIHRSYSGKLIASDIVRKWNIWTIKSPCAAFLQRADTSEPLFLGNSDATGKVYELVTDLMEDDGEPIDQLYFTAGFVPTETGQGMQLGVTRFIAEYMLLVLNGVGVVSIVAYPNTLDTPYATPLLPNFTLPASTNGDIELPMNVPGSRIFLSFESNAVGAAFQLARVIMSMTADPWSPVRGVNG